MPLEPYHLNTRQKNNKWRESAEYEKAAGPYGLTVRLGIEHQRTASILPKDRSGEDTGYFLAYFWVS